MTIGPAIGYTEDLVNTQSSNGCQDARWSFTTQRTIGPDQRHSLPSTLHQALLSMSSAYGLDIPLTSSSFLTISFYSCTTSWPPFTASGSRFWIRLGAEDSSSSSGSDAVWTRGARGRSSGLLLLGRRIVAVRVGEGDGAAERVALRLRRFATARVGEGDGAGERLALRMRRVSGSAVDVAAV